MDKKVVVVVPTYNAGKIWQQVVNSLLLQNDIDNYYVLIIDSGSTDSTIHVAKQAGLDVEHIQQADFNHGTTRNLVLTRYPDAQIVVFLTQDAVLVDSTAIEQLIKVITLDSSVGCAYGRQLPHSNATPLARHARLFNYPEHSYVRSRADIAQYGIKTAFLSNSFSAYRVSSLNAVGGFPAAILAEDMLVAAKMLLAGYQVAYCAQACVYHSHNYSVWQEFKRYFDIGALHSSEPWLLQQFGSATGEGLRFVFSQWQYLLKYAPSSLPLSVIHIAMKWLGYRLGLANIYLSRLLKTQLSTHSKSKFL